MDKENNGLQIPYRSPKSGDCGIACLVMILESRNVRAPTVEDRSKECERDGYYIDQIGRKDDGIVSM